MRNRKSIIGASRKRPGEKKKGALENEAAIVVPVKHLALAILSRNNKV